MSEQPAALQLRLLQTVVAVAAEKNSTLVLPFPVELLRFLERAQQAPPSVVQEPATSATRQPVLPVAQQPVPSVAQPTPPAVQQPVQEQFPSVEPRPNFDA